MEAKMILDTSNIKSNIPMGFADVSELTGYLNNARIEPWEPGCKGACVFTVKYPKYIRKKYHSPKRRAIEWIKSLNLHQFKNRVCKTTLLNNHPFRLPYRHSFGMRVLNPENVYVLSVDEHESLHKGD